MFFDASAVSSDVLRLARQRVLHMVCEINVLELPVAFGKSREAPQDNIHVEIDNVFHRGRDAFSVAADHGAHAISITLHYTCSPKVRAGGNAALPPVLIPVVTRYYQH